MKEEEILEEVDYYDKLPVIYWKEILQEGPKNVYNRRPAKMHRTMTFRTAARWIEKIVGVLMDKIEFVGAPLADWTPRQLLTSK